jgi:serine O-acetyltransferase
MLAISTVPCIGTSRPGLWRQVREDVVCVKARDPAARFTLEIVLTYPGVHAMLCYRIANRLWRGGFRFLARQLSWFARLVSNVDIHPGPPSAVASSLTTAPAW